MPRTRSSIARAAPKPHKLPTDILTRVAAFACDDELARLALSAKSALAALDNQQIWAATLRTNHGGLVIRAEPSGLKAAARLAEARTNKGPVYGCHALASDVGSYSDAYWVDAMFQPERYRAFYSAEGGERLFCAATFLTGGAHDPDRQWMIDTLREVYTDFHLEASFSVLPVTLAAVFHSTFHNSNVDSIHRVFDNERIQQKCREIEERFAAGESRERTGLDATAFQERDDGVEVDARVEALCGGARQATVIATGLVIRRPSRNATCPGRLFMLFGCRRPPRASDLSGAKQLAVGAAPMCRMLVDAAINAMGGEVAIGGSVRGLRGLADLGVTEAGRLPLSTPGRNEGSVFQLCGSDEEIFPLAFGGFRRNLDDEVTELRAGLRKPVAIQGIIVAILEVENRMPDWDVNVDMEYVGVEGYTYA